MCVGAPLSWDWDWQLLYWLQWFTHSTVFLYSFFKWRILKRLSHSPHLIDITALHRWIRLFVRCLSKSREAFWIRQKLKQATKHGFDAWPSWSNVSRSEGSSTGQELFAQSPFVLTMQFTWQKRANTPALSHRYRIMHIKNGSMLCYWKYESTIQCILAHQNIQSYVTIVPLPPIDPSESQPITLQIQWDPRNYFTQTFMMIDDSCKTYWISADHSQVDPVES